MPTNTVKLLFLCTGNTCRSQMAHALSLHWAKNHGLRIAIESRGIRATNGQPTTADAVSVLAKANVPWRGHSQQLCATDLKWADLVWGMTQQHLDYAQQLGSNVAVNQQPVYQLLAGSQELADPLNCGLMEYEELLQKLQQLLPSRLQEIQNSSEA